jgi:DNA-binding CsgD family transcriptional regulator
MNRASTLADYLGRTLPPVEVAALVLLLSAQLRTHGACVFGACTQPARTRGLCARHYSSLQRCVGMLPSLPQGLTPRDLEMIAARRSGQTLAQIGKAYGVSRQLVHQRLKRASR